MGVQHKGTGSVENETVFQCDMWGTWTGVPLERVCSRT
jgi:hypothetical protein